MFDKPEMTDEEIEEMRRIQEKDMEERRLKAMDVFEKKVIDFNEHENPVYHERLSCKILSNGLLDCRRKLRNDPYKDHYSGGKSIDVFNAVSIHNVPVYIEGGVLLASPSRCLPRITGDTGERKELVCRNALDFTYVTDKMLE